MTNVRTLILSKQFSLERIKYLCGIEICWSEIRSSNIFLSFSLISISKISNGHIFLAVPAKKFVLSQLSFYFQGDSNDIKFAMIGWKSSQITAIATNWGKCFKDVHFTRISGVHAVCEPLDTVTNLQVIGHPAVPVVKAKLKTPSAHCPLSVHVTEPQTHREKEHSSSSTLCHRI